MRVLLWVRADGSVAAVLYPNPRQQRPGEEETAFLARLADAAETGSPTLAGLRREIVDHTALPAERVRRTPTAHVDVRAAWRWQDGRVVIDETAVRPLRLPTP